MLFEVAVKSPLHQLFTYESQEPLIKGARVKVPFGSREVLGFVWRETSKAPDGLKTISAVYDQQPLFTESTLEFYEFASQYYGVSLGELLSASLPKNIRDGKALKDFSDRSFHPSLVALSEAQKAVVKKMEESNSSASFLLMGDTGSGKTEIYLQRMTDVLMAGGQVLFLVPEISLTPQLEKRLSQRMGSELSVFHSNLKESRRYETFCRALSGKPDIFLGARSALFLPYKNLKLIVVDEEHDGSFKQSERAPYHARDLALWRAKREKIQIILGSATPSLESYHRALQGKHTLLTLPKYFETPKPSLEIVDLKSHFKNGQKEFISRELQEAIDTALSDGQQSLIFLNRRGSASGRICQSCGQKEECKHCSVQLTLHKDSHRLICHWCGYQKKITPQCESCGDKNFFEGGIGTKEVEAQLRLRFPEARIARLDRDQTSKKNILDETLLKFEKGEIDILVGTQMISKGLDIAKLSLVGMVLADQGWSVPDFRSLERSFQLLTQLIGRAGRRGQNSKILIQTFQPDHPIFKWIQEAAAYQTFADGELALRKMADLPPYTRLLLLTFSDRQEERLKQVSQGFLSRLEAAIKTMGLMAVGPVPAPLARWKGQFRYQILIKGSPEVPITGLLKAMTDDLSTHRLKVKIKIDRDPHHFM